MNGWSVLLNIQQLLRQVGLMWDENTFKIFAISGLDTLKKECHKILDKIAHFFASTDHLPLPAVNGVFRILLGPHASCPPRSGLSPPNRDLPTNQKAVSRSNDFSRPIRLQPRDAPGPGFLYTRFDRTSQ